MKIVNDLDQNTPKWLDWRRLGIGASDAPAICGVCPYRSPYDVYLEKLDLSLQTENEWMKRGKNYEEEARIVFNTDKNHNFEPILIEHDEFSHFRASLDGYCSFNREILEIKIPGATTLQKVANGIVPKNYMYQIQWQLYVAYAQKAHLFVYHPETMKSYTLSITPDEKIRDEMIEKAHQFWADLQNGVPPEDAKKAHPIQHERSKTLMDEIVMLKAVNKANDDLISKKREELFELEGTAYSIESATAVFRRSEVSRIDYKKACQDNHLDLSKYQGKKTVTWTIKEKKFD